MDNMPPNPPLGIRNMNPGNILTSTMYTWRGQDGADDAGHCKFIDPIYGLRAICITIVNYGLYHGCRTLSDYLGMWSKGSKGGDPNYANGVAHWLGLNADDPFDPHAFAKPLLRCIVKMENGIMPYSDDQLNRAITAAHVR